MKHLFEFLFKQNKQTKNSTLYHHHRLVSENWEMNMTVGRRGLQHNEDTTAALPGYSPRTAEQGTVGRERALRATKMPQHSFE